MKHTAQPRRAYAPRLPPAERREQLLDAALAVIARDGYAGISIDAIAREAGVTRPVVYGTFDRLDDLLEALLDRQEQRALARLLDALAGEPGEQPELFIVAVVRRLIAEVTGDPLTWRPILLAPEGTPRRVRARIDRDREIVRSRIESMLAQAADAEIVSHMLIASAEYFGRMLVEDPDRVDGERLVATITRLMRFVSSG